MVLQEVIDWVLKNKLVTVLSVLLFSFFVATISLAVQSNNRQDDLELCLYKLDRLTSTTEKTTELTSIKPVTTTQQMTTDITTEKIESTTENPTTSSTSPNEVDYRLPRSVKPNSYAIKLNPNLEKATFEGDATITISVNESIDSLVLHSNGLEIKELTLKLVESTENIKNNVSFSDDKRELLIIRPVSELQNGQYELKISYGGKLDGIVGFYGSTLKSGKKMASSKFEPTYARQAFPCFDEPAMKATYKVQIVTPQDYIALSNMDEVESENIEDNNKLVSFRESVPMSTYLVCFIVCDFKHINTTIESSVGNDFELRVFAVDGQTEKVSFAKDVGKAVTEYYIKYFNLSYPLPKLDMIAIPDFVSGAMEHWGLVTYRETNLLYDAKTTSTANKQNIARVVAHEISHMWFGNLVTMNWWSDLWLNEGFASYMQYKALNELFPEWKTLEQFLGANTHTIMDLDGTLSSHPIVQTVQTPDEITAIFDKITYNKGAAIIRMLENFVGAEDFQKGISNYLKKYEYKNTVTQDLIDELASIFENKNKDLNLTYIMDTWTRQMGLPIIFVKKINDSLYELSQKRFLANPNTTPTAPSDYNDRWFIPITYKTDKQKENLIWFSDKETTLKLSLNNGEKLLKFNNDQVGYYRVNYPETMWKELINEMSNSINNTEGTLTASDRAHLINDVFTLAEGSEVSFDLALDLSQYLIKELDYAPWSVASSYLKGLSSIMSNSVAYIELREYIRSLLTNIYAEVGWNDVQQEEDDKDQHVKNLLRSVILNLVCSMGESDALKEANTLFSKWLEEMKEPNKSDIDPDLKSTVYYYGIQSTGEQEWLDLWTIFKKEEDPQEISKLMNALSASKSPAILQRYLTLAWDETNIRAQDHLSVLQQISANPIGTPLVWDHVREKWGDLVEKFTLNSRTLGTMIPAITSSFATENRLKELEQFFEDNPEAGAGAAARDQARENIKNNILWLQTHEKTVRNWLQNKKQKKL